MDDDAQARAACGEDVAVDGDLPATMPPRYRAAVLIAAWDGLRFGKLAELRRRDVAMLALADGREMYVINVARAVTRFGDRFAQMLQATIAKAQKRLGHSTFVAAMR